MNTLKTTLLITALAILPGAVFMQDGPFVTDIENGDIDGDGSRNITDIIGLVNYLFAGGAPPVQAYCSFSDQTVGTMRWEPETINGDLDNSGAIDITDVIYMVNWLFSGGSEPQPLECDWEVPR